MADRPVLNQHPLFRCPECRKGGFKSLKALCAHFESLQHVPLCQTCSGISFDNARSYLRHFHKDDGLKCQTKFCITYYQTQRSGAPQRPPAKEGVKRPKNTKGNQQVTISTNVQKTSIPQRNNPQSPKRDLVQTPTSKEINSLISSTSNLSVGSAPVCTKEAKLMNIPAAIDTQYSTMSQIDLILEYLKAKRHPRARLQAEGYFLGKLCMTKDQRAGKRALRDEEYLPTPQITSPVSKRTAIVLDCEMVSVVGGRSAVVSLSAIDFFTGEVLINDLVNPTERVIAWRARYSGVSYTMMRRACASGEALRGWKAARQKLWEFMDVETILIGHSLDNDLEVLGILHYNIVDTAILTAEAVFLPISHTTRMRRRWGLKPLANEFLNDEIQVGKGHSALEDACATRDVLVWCMCNPDLLQVWGAQNKIKEEKRVADEKEKRAAIAKAKLAADAKKKILAAEAK